MDRHELTRRVKNKAQRLGFQAVGIAAVSSIPPERLRAWIKRQYHGQMGYMERTVEKRLNPRQVLDGALSIVSVALSYYHPGELPDDRPDQGVISRYAAGDDYHDLLEAKLEELLGFVKDLVPGVSGKVYVDTGPVLDKWWASRSGIGWLGKHTNILAKGGLGSWFFIGEILLDVELGYDPPGRDHCGSCRRCIEACPTGAIVQPYLLDSRKCISYLTIELRGDIPENLRRPMDNLIYGCDICQDVCPWNRKAVHSRVGEFAPREVNLGPQLRELARMSVEDFRRAYRGSAIRRTKWRGLMRNVAIAMGNSGDPEMIPELRALLNSDEPLVRRHAAWALNEIGGDEALAAIRQRLELESDPATSRALSKLLVPVGRQGAIHRG
ncbi:MAG: tRNA epoxyqueuosine(34) reductase QueG [Acidobacteriota bacterium]